MKTTIYWAYDGHREAMKRAVMRTNPITWKGNIDRQFASALYLLTGLPDAWERLKPHIKPGGTIDHHGMLDQESLTHEERFIVALSWNLFNEGNYYFKITPVDLATLDDAMMNLALSGIVLRHGRPNVAMFEEEKAKCTDFVTAHCPYCHKSVDLRWDFAIQGVEIHCPVCGRSFLLNGKASKKTGK